MECKERYFSRVIWLLSSKDIYFRKCQTADEKKSEEDEQTLEELNSAHRRSHWTKMTASTNQLLETS